MNNTDFENAFAKYVAGVTQMYRTWAMPTYQDADVYTTRGPRYVKVFTKGGSQSSIHSLVDTTNGDIYKAAGVKGPARNGKRGSIYALDNGLSAVNWHGPHYRR